MTLLEGNIPAISYKDFVPKFMKAGTYDWNKSEGNLIVYGRGGNGSEVHIDYLQLPPKYKAAVNAAYGFTCEADMWAYLAKAPIRDLIQPDYKAIEYFNAFTSAAGNPLSEKHLVEYPNDAAILNALRHLLNDKRALKRVLNVQIGKFWNAACELIKTLKNDPRYPNSLPTSERRLKPLYNTYCASGYAALISEKYGNDSSKKHGDSFTHLIMSLYCRPGSKPYARDVHEDYKKFMAGKIELVDSATGELFNPKDYYQDGQPVTISQTQVWNIINKPINRATADSIRNSSLYNTRNKPLVHRHSPVFSFSKITMDDIQFPFKLTDGEAAVGYRIFDVTSGCIIGKSYGKSAGKESGKDRGLFMEALKDMFRTIALNGWGIPAEIEVEHHISNTFKDDLLKEGYLFPFVRFCLPGNPAEKRAEHNIRNFKYSQQHKQEGFHGRFYGRTEANVPNADKVSKKYTFDELIANDAEHITAHHAAEHPKYPGKTRWQVLCEKQNPQLSMPNMPVLAKYVGDTTRDAVQIYNNQWFWAGGHKYEIPTEVRERLATRYIIPYWIAPAHSSAQLQPAPVVYIYQNDKYLACCKLIETFNESRAERTDRDAEIMQDQFAYRKQFDNQIKERKAALTKVKVEKPYAPLNPPAGGRMAPVKIVDTARYEPEPERVTANEDYWKELAEADL